MFQFKNLAGFLCIWITILSNFNAEKTNGIVVVDYNLCQNVDYAPVICIKFGEKYYYFDDIPKVTWLAAMHNCRRNNGNLVTIETAEEMRAISDYLEAPRRGKVKNYAIWTAGNNLAKHTEFMSVGNGRKLSYTNWAQNQPDNSEENNNCVALQVENNAFAMFDIDCQQEHPYICELNTTIAKRQEFV